MNKEMNELFKDFEKLAKKHKDKITSQEFVYFMTSSICLFDYNNAPTIEEALEFIDLAKLKSLEFFEQNKHTSCN